MRLKTVAILGLTLAGFALRLHYLITSHPFFDEYTTVLAAREILQRGWPVLPSGLFYEHGLLATYLIAPFTALFINTPTAEWQPAHWGLMLSRWPSALISTAAIPLIFAVGRVNNGQELRIPKLKNPHEYVSSISLLAAGLFAFSPEGVVWGGRARMYALATWLVLLVVYWAYRGIVHPAKARYRGWAWLALLMALLTQLGAMLLVPPLLGGMVVIGWLSYRAAKNRETEGESQSLTPLVSRLTSCLSRPWFLRPTLIGEGLVLAAIVGAAVWVKRLGQPLGAATLAGSDSSDLPGELVSTVTYQTAIHLNWADAVDFLAKQFGPPHHFWLAVLVVTGIIIWLIRFMIYDRHFRFTARKSGPALHLPPFFTLFLWLVFGLIVVEMVTLLEPFRRNPRYLVMFLPFFYLITAEAVMRLTSPLQRFISPPLIALTFLLIFTGLGWDDLRVALVTPEPAYEEAFQYIQANRQPGDGLLTMNTPAAGLYQGTANGFTVQNEADQFLLREETGPVDRWMGVPWVGTAADFYAALNSHPRTWFVIDTIRLPVYFRGNWQASLNSQMDQVWAKDNALVFLTRPNRDPLPTEPATRLEVILGDSVKLDGYTLQLPNTSPSPSQTINLPYPLSKLSLTLFWQSLAPLDTDYTVFLHLRNLNGATVAQHDSLSLEGAYPTGRWQPGETVIDPLTLPLPANLPPGRYTLWVGMYRLDTLERLPVANDLSGENAIRLGEINLIQPPP